jgi:hypothetical protein
MRRHKIVTGLNGESVNHQPYYPQNADSFPAFLAPAGVFPFDSVILTSALISDAAQHIADGAAIGIEAATVPFFQARSQNGAAGHDGVPFQ